MNKRLVVVQQYLSWKGHYRQYFENLLSPAYSNISASNQPENYPNGIWIKSKFNSEKPLTISQKIKGRFFDSFNVYRLLRKPGFDIVHLLEFEPVCYLLFCNAINKYSKLIITIHSSDKLHYQSWINNKASALHRFLLNKALRKAMVNEAIIITHYEVHRQAILDSIGNQYANQVKVIEYPAPQPQYLAVKQLKSNPPKFLIYGQIREDKGIYEFLKNEATQKLNITIAGKIVDKRILEYTSNNNLTIIDKFLTEEEIDELVDSHDYMLLPYSLNYTNGAGTFKDSLSKAMPVVCSNISIFREIIDKNKVGIIFTSPENIVSEVNRISEEEFKKLSHNCLKYAQVYNWDYMRQAYFDLYREMLF